MRAVLLLLAAIGFLAASPAVATPFSAPLSDAELSSLHGGAVPGQKRLMTDTDAVTNFRLTSDINRTTFDNWFANEGAILIVNNLLR